jgi:gliding motility-associated-like protein
MQHEALPYRIHYPKIFLLSFLFFSYTAVTAQEICDNGKDDDGDGLIDLKDPDCQCYWKATGNILLNPSFEELNHCEVDPYNYANNYDVLKYWQFGVQPYGRDVYFWYNYSCPTDVYYMQTIPPKLPLPDGKGFVFFNHDGNADPNSPEIEQRRNYLAQCLQTPLLKDRSYTLSFFAERPKAIWNNNFYPLPFSVAVFGHSNCNAVPFGVYNQPSGCPADFGWITLGQKKVFSANDWVQSKIELTIPEDINVIEIGPDCSGLYLDSLQYKSNSTYYLDDLQLLETKDFNFQYIQKLSGNACNGGYVLKAPTGVNATYQWYKDSIAVVGETDSMLHIAESSVSAYYNVRIKKGGECQISEPFLVTRSTLSLLHLPTDTITCDDTLIKLGQSLPGVSYTWNGLKDTVVTITQSGRYNIVASDTLGCIKSFTLNAVFKNCKSCTVFMPTAFTPNDDGLNDVFRGVSNCPVPEYHLEIYNRWGQKLFESNSSNKTWDGKLNGKPVANGVYIYVAQYKNSINDTFKIKKGTVALIR